MKIGLEKASLLSHVHIFFKLKQKESERDGEREGDERERWRGRWRGRYLLGIIVVYPAPVLEHIVCHHATHTHTHTYTYTHTHALKKLYARLHAYTPT